MRRIFFITALLCLAYTALVWANPKVAIVKATDINLACYDWKVDVFDITKKWEAYWTGAGAAEIEKMVRKAVDLAGDFPVKRGDTVVIKTNLVENVTHYLYAIYPYRPPPDPEYANKFIQSMVVDARVARAVALICKERGAKEVTIVGGPLSGSAYRSFDVYGYTKMAKEIKVGLYDVSDGPFKNYKGPRGLGLDRYTLPRKVVQADVQISVGAMKTHQIAGVTLSLKNWGVGIPPGSVYGAFKTGLPHYVLYQVITAVNWISKVDYAFIDGLWGMEGLGPLQGEPVEMGLIIAGADPVAVDTVAGRCMDFDPLHFGHIRMAKEYGIGTYEHIEVVGEKIEDVKKDFIPVPVEFRLPDEWGGNTGWD